MTKYWWRSEKVQADRLIRAQPYLEGFPNVPLEAASKRLPVVAALFPNGVDVITNGVTGTSIPLYDDDASADSIDAYIVDPTLWQRYEQSGRERVLCAFGQVDFWATVYDDYAPPTARARPGCFRIDRRLIRTEQYRRAIG